MRLFLSSVRDEDLGKVVEFSLGCGPRQSKRMGDLMHHAAIHRIHHWGFRTVIDFEMLVYIGQYQSP